MQQYTVVSAAMSDEQFQQASRAELREIIEELERRIAELEAEVARLRKDSSTSSKPPSSDIVKPSKRSARPESGKRRSRGGQPGHPRHERPPFTPEEVDATHEYKLEACPQCNGPVQLNGSMAPVVVQQVELVEKPVRIEEHRGLAGWCEGCQQWHYPSLPPEVEQGGLLGPRLTAHIAYLKGACHCSYTTVANYMRDALGVSVSRGYLNKVINKTSEALAAPYEELCEALPAQPHLNVDETGHKENKQGIWTWCFRAELFTCFKIAESRSAQVLHELLGETFGGVLGCDYYSAYRKYLREAGVRVQFCLAHLIRDVRYLTTLPDPQTQAYGQRLLYLLGQLFKTLHESGQMTPAEVISRRTTLQQLMLATARNAPPGREAQNMAKRFEQHGESYFQFVTTPGVEPTNNLAEQAIRFVVIDRHITQGTRSPRGRRWSERIWTTLATCHTQQRSAYTFLEQAIKAHFRGEPAPSLLPASP